MLDPQKSYRDSAEPLQSTGKLAQAQNARGQTGPSSGFDSRLGYLLNESRGRRRRLQSTPATTLLLPSVVGSDSHAAVRHVAQEAGASSDAATRSVEKAASPPATAGMARTTLRWQLLASVRIPCGVRRTGLQHCGAREGSGDGRSRGRRTPLVESVSNFQAALLTRVGVGRCGGIGAGIGASTISQHRHNGRPCNALGHSPCLVG